MPQDIDLGQSWSLYKLLHSRFYKMMFVDLAIVGGEVTSELSACESTRFGRKVKQQRTAYLIFSVAGDAVTGGGGAINSFSRAPLLIVLISEASHRPVLRKCRKA